MKSNYLVPISIFAALFFLSCAHNKIGTEASQSKSQELNLSTFYAEFQKFWAIAKNKDFPSQVELWNSMVESTHQEFYDSIVWSNKLAPDFKERRLKRLKVVFTSYTENEKRIEKNFLDFNKTIYSQIEKFRKFFPDAQFSIAIEGVLSPTFNGKTASLPSRPNQPILAFGIDMITERNDNPDVLYSHELFHIYHGEAIGIKDDGVMVDSFLTMPLWAEGMASFASHELNTDASLTDVFMDKELAALPEAKIPRLAKEFLKVATERVSTTGASENYRKWFMMTYTFDPNFPSRCGYLLGYKVVERLRRQHSLDEMAHWKPTEVHKQILATLKEL